MLTLLMVPAALATQVAPVTDYDGRYALRCEEAALGVDLGLTVNVAGQSWSWGDAGQVTLPCELPVRHLVAWARDVEAGCVAGGLPADACEDFARGLFDVMRPYTRVGRDVLPRGVALTTVWSDLGDLFGVYEAVGDHHFWDGRVERWSYWLDNNVGSEGHLVSLGLGGQGVSDDQGFCLGTAVAGIDGWIDRDAGFTLSADYAVNTSLTCGGAIAGGAWAGTIGLTFSAGVEGRRVP